MFLIIIIILWLSTIAPYHKKCHLHCTFSAVHNSTHNGIVYSLFVYLYCSLDIAVSFLYGRSVVVVSTTVVLVNYS